MKDEMPNCFFPQTFLLLYDLVSFVSFIHCHPLYFAYFLFFLPNIFKLLSFLSPLLLSTSLLLITLLTASPHTNTPPETSISQCGFFAATFQKAVDALRTSPESDARLTLIELLASTVPELKEVVEPQHITNNVEENRHKIANETQKVPSLCHRSDELEFKQGVSASEAFTNKEEANPINVSLENHQKEVESPKSSVFEHKMPQELTNSVSENPTKVILEKKSEEREKVVSLGLDSLVCTLQNPVKDSLGIDPEASESEEITSSSPESYGFEVETSSTFSQEPSFKEGEKPPEITPGKVMSLVGKIEGIRPWSPRNFRSEKSSNGLFSLDSSCSSPGGFGSMRREKEWKRTLACKLYEERLGVDGAEGMDLLWETYEADSRKDSNFKQSKVKEYIDRYEEEEEEEEEEEADNDGKFCCLQALRFSTGKMNLNLGMRKPSLVKVSKALKGMGMVVRGKRKIF